MASTPSPHDVIPQRPTPTKLHACPHLIKIPHAALCSAMHART